jgi:hypothetical protein
MLCTKNEESSDKPRPQESVARFGAVSFPILASLSNASGAVYARVPDPPSRSIENELSVAFPKSLSLQVGRRASSSQCRRTFSAYYRIVQLSDFVKLDSRKLGSLMKRETAHLQIEMQNVAGV